MILQKFYHFALNVTVLLISVTSLYSQNVASSVLVWEVEQTTDQQTNQTIDYQAKFKTVGSSSMSWIQKGGKKITTYEVTGTEGAWANVSASGSFTYLLKRNGNNARMVIEKNIRGTTIILEFLLPGEQTVQHRFKVKSVQPD